MKFCSIENENERSLCYHFSFSFAIAQQAVRIRFDLIKTKKNLFLKNSIRRRSTPNEILSASHFSSFDVKNVNGNCCYNLWFFIFCLLIDALNFSFSFTFWLAQTKRNFVFCTLLCLNQVYSWTNDEMWRKGFESLRSTKRKTSRTKFGRILWFKKKNQTFQCTCKVVQIFLEKRLRIYLSELGFWKERK